MLGLRFDVVLLLALRLAHQLVELSCLLAAWIQPAVALRHGEQAGQFSVIEPLSFLNVFHLTAWTCWLYFSSHIDAQSHHNPNACWWPRCCAGSGQPDPGIVIIGRDVIEC